VSNWFSQVTAVTTMNLRNIPQRAASSIVALVGVAGVVTVVVGVLSIKEGFRAALDLSGAEDVAIVLRGGATDEMSSTLGQTQVRIISDAPQIARDGSGAITSAELYVIVDVPMRSTGTPANVPFRGVNDRASELRQEFKIVAGRTFTPGTFEVIVGRGAAAQFAGLEIGKRLRWGTADWTVTGLFEDGGSVAESEIWTSAAVLQSVYNRGTSYQSTRVRLNDAGALQAFKDTLSQDPQLNVKVFTEKQYYEEQSRLLVTLVSTLGAAIAVLMGLGAVFAALNTMYSAVSARTREIATLRALGFSAGPVVVSVLTEGLALGLVGGALGMLIAYFGFNGLQASTMNFASFSQITFAFTVTPALLLTGLLYALALGLLGGLLPSLRAARMPIVTGLREL
jgi:putative ABC transport system permease protein